MGHMDEEIIKTKKQLAEVHKDTTSEENTAKELEASIFDGEVHILGEKVLFSERMIPELKLSIYMPEIFFQFNHDMRNLLYPIGNNPTHVFGGENIQFQMAFNKTENKVPNDGILKFMPIAKKLLENMGPKTKVVGTGTVDHDSHTVGIMEFVSRAVDMNVYNVMFFFSMEGQLIIGTVNFPVKYRKRMIKIAKELIDSLKFVEVES